MTKRKMTNKKTMKKKAKRRPMGLGLCCARGVCCQMASFLFSPFLCCAARVHVRLYIFLLTCPCSLPKSVSDVSSGRTRRRAVFDADTSQGDETADTLTYAGDSDDSEVWSPAPMLAVSDE